MPIRERREGFERPEMLPNFVLCESSACVQKECCRQKVQNIYLDMVGKGSLGMGLLPFNLYGTIVLDSTLCKVLWTFAYYASFHPIYIRLLKVVSEF